MNRNIRERLLTAIIVLAVLMVPLLGRGAVSPCMYIRQYAISLPWQGGRIVVPDAGIRSFPPLCLMIRGPYRYMS